MSTAFQAVDKNKKRKILNENLEKGTVFFQTTNHNNRLVACKYYTVKNKPDFKGALDVFNLSQISYG